MGRDLVLGKRGGLPALLLTVILAGCAQSAGLGNLSLLGNAQEGGETVSEGEAQAQLAALAPGEIPPLPTRRPGKRPRSPAPAAEAAPPAPAPETAEPAKSEGSGLSLASLGDSLFSPSSSSSSEGESGPDSILVDQPPIGAYSLLAQRIKYCWLNPTTPRLPNHGFFAEMPAGEVRETKMIVYEKNAEGRRGTTVFKVDITAESSGALVTARNARLDKATETSFKADLARWAKGDDRCKP